MKTTTIDEESESSQMSSPNMLKKLSSPRIGSFKITPRKITSINKNFSAESVTQSDSTTPKIAILQKNNNSIEEQSE